MATALDNVDARRYIDAQCVKYGRWLLDSGTLGKHFGYIFHGISLPYNQSHTLLFAIYSHSQYTLIPNLTYRYNRPSPSRMPF